MFLYTTIEAIVAIIAGILIAVCTKKTDDVQTVADIFQTRIDIGADNTNYPESAAGWQLYAQV